MPASFQPALRRAAQGEETLGRVSNHSVRRNGTKVLSVGLALAVGACSHAPLRPFDCKAVLGLRLGQSQDEVRALVGKPHREDAGQHWWENEAGERTQVADYTMYFNDFGAPGWLPTSNDVFWINFFKNRLVKVTAFRADEFLTSYEDSVGLALGSPSFGQPSPRSNNRPEPIRATIGPAFNKIFQCRPDATLEKAQAEFEAQVKVR